MSRSSALTTEWPVTLELPSPDRAFDFVVAFMSLMDISELDRALSEAYRVLKEAGFLQFAIYATAPTIRRCEAGRRADETGQKVALQCGGYLDEIEGVEEWLFFFGTPDALKQRLPNFCPQVLQDVEYVVELAPGRGLRAGAVSGTSLQ